MFFIRSFTIFFLLSFLLTSCGKFNPFNDQIDSTSDGSTVVETQMSDRELLENGLIVVYRFQSVPNLVAVRHSDTTSAKSASFSAPRLASLISQNAKNRPSNTKKGSNNVVSTNCSSAYCEAGFNNAITLIHNNNLTLNPVQVAVIDSGVLASTNAIKNILYTSSNIDGDTNVNDWLPHATMIASLFAGVMNSVNSPAVDVYAPNSQIHSLKITFANDSDTSMQQQYGSMQLAVALDQAIAGGAKIVNLSLTYNNKPDDNVAFAEQGIMSAAAQKGVLFVAAAGNDGINIDNNLVYPAAYNVNNLIVAGSHTSSLQKANSSNFGSLVDVSAQGASIMVNDKSGSVNYAGGTSFAAPLIVSALSLYLGINHNPNLSINDILSDLFISSNNYYAYNYGKIISNYGRLNAEALIQAGINHSL